MERAAGGEANFAALSQVAGAGSSQAHRYQNVDTAPLTLGYYRLRQVNAATGQVSYSPVVAV
ncbi:MAG: hypothetical protein ACRYFK_16340 [Janthinobacterium lividum]